MPALIGAAASFLPHHAKAGAVVVVLLLGF
jgi:hypothetical protein